MMYIIMIGCVYFFPPETDIIFVVQVRCMQKKKKKQQQKKKKINKKIKIKTK